MARKLFVNLATRDLHKTIAFFKHLGFAFNPQFTNDDAGCMIVSDDAFVMLLTHRHFGGFTKKPIVDSRETTEAILAFSVDSRQEVDALVDRALATGATTANPPQDHGFMYLRSFYDLDGHLWECTWMDPRFLKK